MLPLPIGNDNIPKIFVDSHTKRSELRESYQLQKSRSALILFSAAQALRCGDEAPLPVSGKWVRASARKHAFGSRLRQAKCSACPTCGWVKPRSPAVQVLAAQALSALRGDVVWFFLHFFRPSISPSSAGQIAPGLWHKPVADGNQGNGPAPGTRPPHAPVPLRRGYGAILSPGRHTGAHRGK